MREGKPSKDMDLDLDNDSHGAPPISIMEKDPLSTDPVLRRTRRPKRQSVEAIESVNIPGPPNKREANIARRKSGIAYH